jgi:hypothetical protein
MKKVEIRKKKWNGEKSNEKKERGERNTKKKQSDKRTLI